MEYKTAGTLTQAGVPGIEEMKQINAFTRRTFLPEEVYCFSVVLCDNDIDRDNECFDRKTLEELAEMFVGKTGICDHEASSKNQQARIYQTQLREEAGRLTRQGEPYCALVAKAYMVKTESNRDLILEIEAGIKKEVSVGCSIRSRVCSICGKSRKEGGCEHITGQRYAGKLCYTKLVGAQDAYEWSFVAVPAQREAGIIKSFTEKEDGQGIWLSIRQAEQLEQTVKRLKEDCEQVRKGAKQELRKALGRMEHLSERERELIDGAADSLSLEQINAFYKAFCPIREKELEEMQLIFKETQTNADKRFMI